MTLDLAIRGGTLVTAADTTKTDIGICDGKVVLIGHGLPDAARDIDAHGKLVLPGGVDSHVHIEQASRFLQFFAHHTYFARSVDSSGASWLPFSSS